MSTHAARKLISTFLSAIALLLGLATVALFSALKYKRQVEYTQMAALSNLVTSVSKLNGTLQKFSYTSAPEMSAILSADVWRCAAEAKSALSVLPMDSASIEKTQKFISQSGEYAYSLLKKNTAGQAISAQDTQNIASLSSTADKLAVALARLKADISGGSQNISESFRLFKGENREAVAAVWDANSSSSNVDESDGDFPQYATLIYDGPFSEHIAALKPAFLEGKEEIGAAEARIKAAKILEVSPELLDYSVCNGSTIKTYCFNYDGVYIELSRAGGHIVNYINSRKSENAEALSTDELIKKAVEFLAECGFKDMKESYFFTSNGVTTINFAYEFDGITCYPDLIKVGVYNNSGEIASLESSGYMMNHKQRDIPQNIVSESSAREKVSENLNILSHSLAFIPTAGKNELLCHEFVAETENGQKYIIYVNALTGMQESMFILAESENGTLTI